MPFYLRKSVSAGPFRFNLSKSGVGFSVGVKGLRFGSGPRGNYIHAGRGGIYYRKTISKPGEKSKPHERPEGTASAVEMEAIDSGDVLAMTSASHAELLGRLNDQHNKTSAAVVLGWAFAALVCLAAFVFGLVVLLSLLLIFPIIAFGSWLDQANRTEVLYYDLEDDAERSYRQLTSGFDIAATAKKIWHVSASGDVRDLTTWKQNAGASSLIQRAHIQLGYGLPKVIRSNITPPRIHVGVQTLYLFPDVVLVEDKQKYGAVRYCDLTVECFSSRFIEDDSVPADADVVGYTWKHPNKSGGPDRRFANNHQIPICLYRDMIFSSESGLLEQIEFSKIDACDELQSAICNLAPSSIELAAKDQATFSTKTVPAE